MSLSAGSCDGGDSSGVSAGEGAKEEEEEEDIPGKVRMLEAMTRLSRRREDSSSSVARVRIRGEDGGLDMAGDKRRV